MSCTGLCSNGQPRKYAPEQRPRKYAGQSICFGLLLRSTKLHCSTIVLCLVSCYLICAWQQGWVGGFIQCHAQRATQSVSDRTIFHSPLPPSPLHRLPSPSTRLHTFLTRLCHTVLPFASMPRVSTASMLTCIFCFSSPKMACMSACQPCLLLRTVRAVSSVN